MNDTAEAITTQNASVTGCRHRCSRPPGLRWRKRQRSMWSVPVVVISSFAKVNDSAAISIGSVTPPARTLPPNSANRTGDSTGLRATQAFASIGHAYPFGEWVSFDPGIQRRSRSFAENQSSPVAEGFVVRRGRARIALIEWGDGLQRSVPFSVLLKALRLL